MPYLVLVPGKDSKKSAKENEEGKMVNFACKISMEISEKDWEAFKIVCRRDNKTQQELAGELLKVAIKKFV